MAGALVQIVATGAQNLYLSCKPQITFFKTTHRRHTNFAVESIEQHFSGNLDFGRQANCELSRNGDLINKTYLKVTLPEVTYEGDFNNLGHVQFAWVKHIGHHIIESAELNIGGSTIDKQCGDWMHIWYLLTAQPGHLQGLNEMLGNVPELTQLSSLSWDDPENRTLKCEHDLFIPLNFYFCQNTGSSIPLIALQYHQVKISVKLNQFENLSIYSDAFRQSQSSRKQSISDACLFVDYIFLDVTERKKMAQHSHEYLIEQIQTTGDESVPSSNTKIKLNFNHPIKALYWIVRCRNFMGCKFMVYNSENWEDARENAARKLILAQFDLDDFGFFNNANNEGDSYQVEDRKYMGVNPTSPGSESMFTFSSMGAAQLFGDYTNVVGMLAQDHPLVKISEGSEDLRSKVDGIIRINVDSQDRSMVFPVVEKIIRNNLSIEDLSVPVTSFAVDNRNNYIRAFDVNVNQP